MATRPTLVLTTAIALAVVVIVLRTGGEAPVDAPADPAAGSARDEEDVAPQVVTRSTLAEGEPADTLTEAATVRGVVLDANGRPVRGTARLLDETGRWSGWSETRGNEVEALSDASGAFVLEGVSPGDHTLTVTSVGYRPWTRHLRLPPASDTDVGSILLAPRAEGETVAVFVGSVADPEGAPVEGVAVAVRPRSASEHAIDTDADGRFMLEVPPGKHAVELRLPSRPRVRQRMEFPAGEVVAWHYRYPAGDHFLGGVVVGMANGKPLPHIDVEAQVQRDRDPEVTVSGVTGADGRFHLTGIPDGVVSLLLEWQAPYVDVALANVAVDRDDHRLEFPFPEVVRVHGTVRDRRGAPLAGVTVSAAQMGEDGRCESAVDGRYAVDVPMTSQQAQRFHAEKSGYVSVTSHYLREHGGASASIVWHPILVAEDELGTVRGRVTGGHGDALAGVQVGIFSLQGESTVARAFVETDSEGEYRRAGVRPGRVELLFRAGDHHELRVEEELVPRSTLRRDAVLATVSRGELVYQLVDANEVPISAVKWNAWCSHPRHNADGVTDSDGQIVLRDWPIAGGRIELEHSDGPPGYRVDVPREDRDGKPQRLILRRGNLQLRGRVLDARGNPAARVGVILSDAARDGVRVYDYVQTDEAGAFVFEGLGSGEYRCDLDSVIPTGGTGRAGGPPVEILRGW